MTDLQKAWKECCKLDTEGRKLWDEANRLCDEANRLCDEADKLRAKCEKLWDDSRLIFYNAVIEKYGSDDVIERTSKKVIVNGEEFVKLTGGSDE